MWIMYFAMLSLGELWKELYTMMHLTGIQKEPFQFQKLQDDLMWNFEK